MAQIRPLLIGFATTLGVIAFLLLDRNALVLVALMFPGGSAGSTAGSIKIVRHLVIGRVLRRELDGRGSGPDDTERWRPWRSYAGMHLWRASSAYERTPS